MPGPGQEAGGGTGGRDTETVLKGEIAQGPARPWRPASTKSLEFLLEPAGSGVTSSGRVDLGPS